MRIETANDEAVVLDSLVSSGVRGRADIDALATKANDEVSILLWNYHDADEAAAAAPVQVSITRLPATTQRVRVKQYRIDTNHSNAYTVWKAMGSPQQPTQEQYAQLLDRAGLELIDSPAWHDVQNGTLQLQTEMPRESVSLFEVSW